MITIITKAALMQGPLISEKQKKLFLFIFFITMIPCLWYTFGGVRKAIKLFKKKTNSFIIKFADDSYQLRMKELQEEIVTQKSQLSLAEDIIVQRGNALIKAEERLVCSQKYCEELRARINDINQVNAYLLAELTVTEIRYDYIIRDLEEERDDFREENAQFIKALSML